MRPTARWTLLAALIGAAVFSLGAAADDVAAPAIQRLVWKCPQQLRWSKGGTPMWFSLGHGSRVLAIYPLGVRQADGKAQLTRDGSGAAYAVALEVYQVLAFQGNTSLPAKVKLLESVTLRADAPLAKRLGRWPFPSETNYDWEMGQLPPRQAQYLERLFMHGAERLWHTLMIHAEADAEPLPPALAEAAGAKRAFKTFALHILVMELLNDPDLPLTSTYIEADDPPTRAWIDRQAVKAPWALGKDKLEPVQGSLAFTGADEGVKPVFLELAAAAREAARQQALDNQPRQPKMGDPALHEADGPVEVELEEGN